MTAPVALGISNTPTTWTALLLLATAKELAKDVTKASIAKIKMNILTLKTTKPFKTLKGLSFLEINRKTIFVKNKMEAFSFYFKNT